MGNWQISGAVEKNKMRLISGNSCWRKCDVISIVAMCRCSKNETISLRSITQQNISFTVILFQVFFTHVSHHHSCWGNPGIEVLLWFPCFVLWAFETTTLHVFTNMNFILSEWRIYSYSLVELCIQRFLTMTKETYEAI